MKSETHANSQIMCETVQGSAAPYWQNEISPGQDELGQSSRAAAIDMCNKNNNSNDMGDFTAFDEKSIRLGFVRKVFGILVIQLALTVGVVCLFLFVPAIKEYSQDNIWLYITAWSLTFVMLMVLACIPNLRRNWPINLICLLLFTLFISVALGAICSCYDASEVLAALVLLVIITIICTLFGCQSKFDFTPLISVMMVLTMCLCLFGFMCIWWYDDILYVVYSVLGALLFSMWLVIDIQMVFRGKFVLDPEEYIFGALNIYVDLINIFMFLLVICGR